MLAGFAVDGRRGAQGTPATLAMLSAHVVFEHRLSGHRQGYPSGHLPLDANGTTTCVSEPRDFFAQTSFSGEDVEAYHSKLEYAVDWLGRDHCTESS